MYIYNSIRLCIVSQYVFMNLYILMKRSILKRMVDMNIKNEIKAAIYESGHTLNEVAEKIGISDTSLSNMLSRQSIRYSLAKQIAEVIGFELRFRKKD